MPTTHLRKGLNSVADGVAPAWWSTLQWSRGGRVTSSIGCTITTRAGVGLVRLQYTTTRPSGEKIDNDYQVLTVPTIPYYGGRRWWWICPLTKNGRQCGRRVGKLYLPPGGLYFGCRQCYALTYESAQEHDPRVSRLANDPMALYAAMRGAIDDAGDDTLMSASRLILTLKAHDQVARRERRQSRRW
jgi:hypothetical protein